MVMKVEIDGCLHDKIRDTWVSHAKIAHDLEHHNIHSTNDVSQLKRRGG